MRGKFMAGMVAGYALCWALTGLLSMTRPSPDAYRDRVTAHLHAQRELDILASRAGILPPRLLESSAIIGAYADREVVTGDPVVILDSFLMAAGRAALLEGVLAHEVGHHAAGHVDARWRSLTGAQRSALQREADAYGMRLIGERAWRAYLRELGLKDAAIDAQVADLLTVPVRLPLLTDAPR